MFNVTLIGNLGRDAEIVTLSNGKEYMKFSVAVETGHDSFPIWCDVLMSRRDNLQPYLNKGQKVCIIGRCTITIKDNRTFINVYPDQLELCGRWELNSQAETPYA